MKKLLSLLMAGALVLSLAACGTGGNGGSSTAGGTDSKASQGSTSGTDSSAAATDVDTSEHVVITYMTTGDIPTNYTEDALAKVNEILGEKVNAELKLHWIEWTDYMTNYNLTLAAQDGSVDLVGTATDWLDAWPNAKNGAFLKLTEEMLQTYTPQTWETVAADNWELCKYNGDIYLIPEDNYAQWTNHGFMYRGDWAKEAGLADGVHSWEDMATYLQYIKDNMPDVIPWDAAGSGTTIFDALVGGWLGSHTQNIFVEGLGTGLFYGNSKDDPYTLSRYFLEGDELVNFAKTMKEWNDAGYWREDVLNYSGDTRQEFYEGLTGIDQHHTQTWRTQVRAKMDKNFPGSDVGFFYFGEETDNLVSLNITHGAMAVAAASNNPERALMVYDLMRNDEEIYRLINYGMEGEQYTTDGTNLTRPDDFDEAVNGVSFNFWWGRNDNLELKNTAFSWEPYEALIETEYSVNATPYPYGKVVFETDSISSYLDNLSNVYTTYMAQIAFGKQADPEAYVAEFRQALKDAGYEECLAEVQKQIQETYGVA